jgi:rRNA maturation protein Nop10
MTATTQPQPGTLRAICDECGEVRHVTARAGYGKSGDDCGGVRCIVPAKCAHCGRRTVHAYLRDFDPDADDCERADAQQLEPEAVLEAVGMRAIFVDHLGRDGLLLPEHAIVLIDADLSSERIAQVVTQALKAALDGGAERQR